jgi:hypothetical protein
MNDNDNLKPCDLMNDVTFVDERDLMISRYHRSFALFG